MPSPLLSAFASNSSADRGRPFPYSELKRLHSGRTGRHRLKIEPLHGHQPDRQSVPSFAVFPKNLLDKLHEHSGGRHIAGLDGLRGSAALAVIGCHLHAPGCAFGWSGVTLFFVLSGFLITGILLEDKHSEGFYSTFYARRSLRIFSIYYLAIIALFLIERGSDWPYFFAYSQNWLYAVSQTFADDGRIHFSWAASHTWSLAVEEQFYLLWPLAVRNLSGPRLLKLALAMIVIGPFSRFIAVAATGHWWAGYTPLPCQVDMLAWGAFGAIALRQFDRGRIEGLASVALLIGIAVLAGVIASYGHYALQSPAVILSPKGQAFFAFLGPLYLSLLIVAQRGRLVGRLLDTKALAYCGRISYGLYLYHWPILVAVAAAAGSASFAADWRPAALVVPITFVFAAISHRFIETPLLATKDRLFPRDSTPTSPPAPTRSPVPSAAHHSRARSVVWFC